MRLRFHAVGSVSGLVGLALVGLVGVGTTAMASCGSSSNDVNPVDGGSDTPSYPSDPIDGIPAGSQIKLTGLKEPVRVIRDKHGMVHIYARNLHDAALADGYVVALDRAPQLQFFRRLAEGRLAEYAGNLSPDLASQDIFFRAMGLRRTAEKYYATLKEGSDAKVVLDAYAEGVTQYMKGIREGAVSVPNGWLAIPRKKYLDWDAAASLSVARLQTWSLSWDGDTELDNTMVFQAARKTWKADATDAAIKARVGFMEDVLRFEPPALVPVIDAPPMTKSLPTEKPKFVKAPILDAALLANARNVLDSGRRAADAFFGPRGSLGSNNFVLSPTKSTTGKTLVASDPHLQLRAPAIFHMVALHVIPRDGVKPLDVAGMAFSGIPGVVLGFNKNIAWGATVTEFDVQDLYADKIVGNQVKVGGAMVDIVPITEPFDYGDGKPQSITIETIPGHGFIFPTVVDNKFVPRTDTDVISYRWTGLEPTGEFEAFVALNQASNVDEAVKAMDPFQVGSQNFVFGDTQGNIAYTTHANVPVRPKGAFTWNPKTKDGLLPCMVLPGDAGLEWTGKVDDALLPHAKNPAGRTYIATANSDQYGNSFDDDPTNDAVYLGCKWDPGLREARIHERLDALDKLGPDDLAKVQADAKSPLGTRMAKYFVAALQRAEDARTGKTPAADLDAVVKDTKYDPTQIQLAIALLTKWADAGYDTPAATDVAGDATPTDADIAASEATAIFNTSLAPLFHKVFDDEWSAMGNPPFDREWAMKATLRMLEKKVTLATADASGESILWDDMGTPTITESKDERIVRAVLDGLAFLTKTLGNDPKQWRWGKLHTVRFETLVSGTGGQLSIPNDGDSKFPEGGFPRHGDMYVVDASQFSLGSGTSFSYGSGPAQRFVADMNENGVKVRNALPGGNVWIPGSPHFADEAELWRKNENAPVAFSPGEVVPEAEERFDLVP